ncbi:MAG: DUF2066 domain-containing protein [Rhizobiaceae bacterium]|nr:DUF2066 domain-containing protein [Rhizobiaceae bacterium]
MNGIKTKSLAFALLIAGPSPTLAGSIDDLYRAQAIVTGQGEENRQSGFEECLMRVLVKVSGDQRIPDQSEAKQLLGDAARYVRSFTYRDRLAGKPIHDEQGTYDRPHDLICHYDVTVVDGLLAKLGSRPWRAERPTLAVFLKVKRSGPALYLSREDERDTAMVQSMENAASLLDIQIAVPSAEEARRWTASARSPALTEMAHSIGADLPLVGLLEWSDADLGWVAVWRLADGGTEHVWTVRGVNFDEAFRVAVRGTAQILSGNGSP